jgi:hypothetical protein
MDATHWVMIGFFVSSLNYETSANSFGGEVWKGQGLPKQKPNFARGGYVKIEKIDF